MNKLSELGVDKILVINGSDPFATNAMKEKLVVPKLIDMLSDGNGDFAAKYDLILPAQSIGSGNKLKRFAAVAYDGVVGFMQIDENPLECSLSSVYSVIDFLEMNKKRSKPVT